MANGRHVFVCKDGSALPEWCKLPGKVICIRPDALVLHEIDKGDIVWLRPGTTDVGSPDTLQLVKDIARKAFCVVLADIPMDQEALAVFAAGARGYCNSHSNVRVLKLIVNVVRDGGLWIGESLMQRLVVGVSRSIDKHSGSKMLSETTIPLTPREREIAETMAGGASNKDIARLLQISERTVKAHLTTLFNKFGVKDRLQLVIKIKTLK